MKRNISMILAVLCFLAAVGIMVYPAVSSYINEKYRSEIQTVYEEQIQGKDETVLKEVWKQAVAYNSAISPGTMSSDAYSKDAILTASKNYDAMLNITGSGIMGYVEIPKINVYSWLPRSIFTLGIAISFLRILIPSGCRSITSPST